MGVTSGYSTAPLAKKLGIGPDSSVVLLSPPPGLREQLPVAADVSEEPAQADVVVAFFTERSELVRRIESLAGDIFPDGALWVAWPKRASGIATDLSDGQIREVALPLGLVDNKVCAIDQTWTGLRLVWRKQLRS